MRFRDETGAEILEFAILAPVVLLCIFGIVYGLIVTAAQVTLQRAASAGVRAAAISPDADVATVVENAAPMHTGCTTSVTGDAGVNVRVAIDISCPFPNPLGRVLGSFAGAPATGAFAEDIVMTARAVSRSER